MIFLCKSVIEVPGIIDYLESRGLLKQYNKMKEYLMMGCFSQIDFRKREGKDKLFYTKINNQYRAIGEIVGSKFHILYIDDHQ